VLLSGITGVGRASGPVSIHLGVVERYLPTNTPWVRLFSTISAESAAMTRYRDG
jgi:hypothetical protein